jgi:uncharacterized protein YjbJ (UPF0337 family)
MNQSVTPATKDGSDKTSNQGQKTAPGESAWHVGKMAFKQAQQPKTSAEALADKWKRHIGSAKIVWAKLTDEELLKSGGQAENLTSLVQERYAISQDAAGKKVRNFLAQYRL